MTEDVKFFRTESHTISAEEAKRLNSPEVIGQELVFNVKGWIEKALATLSGHPDLRPALDLGAPEWIDLSLPDHAIHELQRVCLKLSKHMPPDNRMETLTSDEKDAVGVLYGIKRLSNTFARLEAPAKSAVVIIKASFDLGFMIAQAHVAPWEPLAESGWLSKTKGGIGGGAKKISKWAEAVAAYLLDHYAGMTKEEMLAGLGDSTCPWEIETDDADIEFYKDGDKLCANIDGEPGRSMSREHFFNTYLKTRKQE